MMGCHWFGRDASFVVWPRVSTSLAFLMLPSTISVGPRPNQHLRCRSRTLSPTARPSLRAATTHNLTRGCLKKLLEIMSFWFADFVIRLLESVIRDPRIAQVQHALSLRPHARMPQPRSCPWPSEPAPRQATQAAPHKLESKLGSHAACVVV